MYLKRFQIDGVKCMESLDLHFPHSDDDYSGWVVLLGGNGTGKSTLLQAMALALVGPLAGQKLLQPQGWVRAPGRAEYGRFEAEIVSGPQDSSVVGKRRRKPYEVAYAVTGTHPAKIDGELYDQPQLVSLTDAANRKALSGGAYAAKRPGWFCCGYGPFRRLSGGDSVDSKLVHSDGAEARFATLFRESVALTRCQDWLTHLYARSLDPYNLQRDKSREDFQTIQDILNVLLPGDVRIIRVDTANVYFTCGGTEVPVPDLSDGYRSFLALVVDILRHVLDSGVELKSLLSLEGGLPAFGIQGIILIDEIDAHLHPRWQRDIGFDLRRVFPKVQLIVTTHSPFIAQAASDDGLIVLKTGESGAVGAVRPVASVRGWRADQILTSPLFGLTGTRDPETEGLIVEHADLVAKQQ